MVNNGPAKNQLNQIDFKHCQLSLTSNKLGIFFDHAPRDNEPQVSCQSTDYSKLCLHDQTYLTFTNELERRAAASFQSPPFVECLNAVEK